MNLEQKQIVLEECLEWLIFLTEDLELRDMSDNCTDYWSMDLEEYAKDKEDYLKNALLRLKSYIVNNITSTNEKIGVDSKSQIWTDGNWGVDYDTIEYSFYNVILPCGTKDYILYSECEDSEECDALDVDFSQSNKSSLHNTEQLLKYLSII